MMEKPDMACTITAIGNPSISSGLEDLLEVTTWSFWDFSSIQINRLVQPVDAVKLKAGVPQG